jgi:rRNA maturation endonuclease Nob1
MSCRGHITYSKLVNADSLLRHDLIDSAYNKLKSIDTYYLDNKSDSMYYNLLLTQAEYRLYKPIKSSAVIDKCISYYEDNGDNEKLASAYYYKGALCHLFGNNNNAVLFFKKAENTAQNVDNIALKHKINQSLSIINNYTGNSNLALYYAKKTIDNCNQANNKEWLATAYMNMASVFSFLRQSDSANYYLKKYIPLIKYVPEERKSTFISGIGFYYYRINDYQKSKWYFEKAIKMKPIAESYALLAEILAKEGQSQKAESLYHAALKNSELFFKIDILQSYSEWKYREGKYKQVGEIDKQIINLKDSLTRQRNSETIHQLQVQYDNRMTENRNKRTILWSAAIISLLVIAIIIFTFYHHRRVKRAQREVDNSQALLDAYNKKLTELSTECIEKSKEVAEQRKKIDDISKQQSEILAKGHDLYEQISSGGNALTWHKQEFIEFIEYYRLNNHQFLQHLENDYKLMSPSNKFFMILYNMGKTDNDVKQIMGMTQGAIRTTRSRIKNKKV